MDNSPIPSLPPLLDLLRRDRSAFDTLVARTPPVDIAEALRGLPPEDATAVMSALPFDVAVKILDEPAAN